MWNKEFTGSLALLLLFSSCSTYTDTTHPLDLQKAVSREIPMKQLCKRIELIPLEESGDTLGKLGKMAVSDQRLFIQDRDNRILSWKMDGKEPLAYHTATAITDFSLYEDQSLEILSDDNVLEYDLNGFTLKNNFQIKDTTAILVSLMRWKHMFHFIGYKEKRLYACEYYIDEGTFFPMEVSSIIPADRMPQVAANCRYFKHESDNYLYYAHSGDVFYLSWVRSPQVFWELSGNDSIPICFDNMQKSDSRLYGTFQWKDRQYLMILKKQEEYPLITTLTREGLEFPLGVIRDNTNYYCCPTSELDRYVNKKVLDRENERVLDSLEDSPGAVLLKYTLP